MNNAFSFDEASEDDRIWFEKHPGVDERIRPPFPDEMALSGGACISVRVIQMAPGIRARTPIISKGTYQ